LWTSMKSGTCYPLLYVSVTFLVTSQMKTRFIAGV
jgi:hypothetical protein